MSFAPPRCCGVYWLLPKPQSDHYHPPTQFQWLPLTHLSAKAHIRHYSAHLTLYQTFVVPPVPLHCCSNLERIESAKYQFPLYPSCSVTSFLAHINSPNEPTRTVKGVIQPVKKAQEIYETAVSEGKTAALLEQQAVDVFLTKLGNLPCKEGTEVKVEIGCVLELSHDSEVDRVRFTIPTSIAPRYGEFTPWNSGGVGEQASTGVATTWGNVVPKGIEMDVQVTMPGPITGIQSPSHPISVTLGSHGSQNTTGFDPAKAVAKLEFLKETFLGKDFVVQVICKEVAAPRAVLEKYDPSTKNGNTNTNTAALMLTFVPKFVIPPAVQTHPSQPKPPGKELIFLIDRSGSMYDKIDSLRSALTVFIKSLPTNINLKFDICSFGSSYQFLFHNNMTVNGSKVKGSQVYNQKTMDMALDFVKTVKSDFGGTELETPIRVICGLAQQREMNRGSGEDSFETEILVLTDGEIWNVDTLCSYVREQTLGWRKGVKEMDEDKGKSGVRVFTLGIGDDVSHGLCESLAKAGGGYSTIVGGNERYEGKVVRMLKAALGQRVGGYQLLWGGMEKWGIKKVDLIVPSDSLKSVTAEDDFEMVDADPEEEKSTAPPIPPIAPPTPPPPIPPMAPISLFDPNADPDAPLDTTHKPVRKELVPTLHPPAFIQSPHNIPSLFAFSRATIYVLLTPPTGTNPPLPENVTLRGYTSSGQPLELTIPVTILEKPGTTIHQLAIKKYLDDLRDGESWIHEAQKKRTKVRCVHTNDNGEQREELIELPLKGFNLGDESEEKFREMVRVEGERVGIGYGVAGKWTSFVAVEEKESSLGQDGEQIIHGAEISTDTVVGFNLPAQAPQQATALHLFGGSSLTAGGKPQAKLLSMNTTYQQQSMQVPKMQLHSAPQPHGFFKASFGAAAPRGRPPPPPPAHSVQYQMAHTTASAPGGALFACSPPQPAYGLQSTLCEGSRDISPSVHLFRATHSEEEYEECDDDTYVKEESKKMATRARKCMAPGSAKMKAAPPPAVAPRLVTREEQTTQLISFQQFNGNWSFTTSPLLVAFLKTHIPNKKVSEQDVRGDETDLWATLFVLIYLEKMLGSEELKEMWELVGDKGWKWAKDNVGGDLGKVQDLRRRITETFFEVVL